MQVMKMSEFTDLPNKKKTKAKAKISKVVAVYYGCGGPPGSSVDESGNKVDPTPAGEYVIQRIGPHVSHGKYVLSMIAWGTPTRMVKEVSAIPGTSEHEKNEVFQVQRNGKWILGTNIHVDLNAANVREAYKALFEGVGKPAPVEIPDKWLLNDFGPNTVYFFKDLDGNKKFDPKTETIQQEMFHTTPDNEMQLAHKKEIVLDYSHGCIHVHPGHFREMVKKRYFKTGATVQIHKYTQTLPIYNLDETAKPPYVIHFFPKPQTILVYGQ
ncbi:MAG: hypothetical protein RL173_2491 [Fibrobacterota bacterium]|jgi:hypothetical protein